MCTYFCLRSALDPLRVTLAVDDGFELDDALISDGVYAELPEASTITFALSAGTTRAHVRRLLRALRAAARPDATPSTTSPKASTPSADLDAAAQPEIGAAGEAGAGAVSATEALPTAPLQPDQKLFALAAAARSSHTWGRGALSPRHAYFRPRRTVPAAAAVGLISAQLACPYPPGIPILVPGERISQVLASERIANRVA